MLQTATGVLSELFDADWAAVQSVVPLIELDYGAAIMQAGDDDPSLIWIVEGEVVLKLGDFEVATAGRGDVIGAAQALSDPIWPVSVKSIRPVRMLLVDRTALHALQAEGNPFATKLELSAIATMSRQLVAVGALIAARADREDLAPPAAPPGGIAKALRALLTPRRAPVDVEAVLRAARLFEGDSDQVIATLAGSFTAVTLPRGSALTEEGKIPERVLLLVEGEVESFVGTGGGQVARLGPVVPGAMLGMTAGASMRHVATRVAVDEVEALSMTADDFRTLIESATEAGAALRRAAILSRHHALIRDYERLRGIHEQTRGAIRSSLAAMDPPHPNR